MLSHRWFIASGFMTLLLSGCGGAKSPQVTLARLKRDEEAIASFEQEFESILMDLSY